MQSSGGGPCPLPRRARDATQNAVILTAKALPLLLPLSPPPPTMAGCEIAIAPIPPSHPCPIPPLLLSSIRWQTIQYIEPSDHKLLAQAELLVVDEAAAIPMPQVRQLLGPYLVFLASTVNGYEGTGRALSLKLIQQLRAGKAPTAAAAGSADAGTTASNAVDGAALVAAKAAAEGGLAAGGDGSSGAARTLREVSLDEPIRYARGDPIERWLHDILCLDATSHTPPITGCPHPSECSLYWIDRDALFSYHSASEAFLQRMIALFVASHYKNTPNDLQLMSDAPAHQLFVLLGPVDINATRLPDVVAVVQVMLSMHCLAYGPPPRTQPRARCPHPCRHRSCLTLHAPQTRIYHILWHTCKLRSSFYHELCQ